MDTQKSRNYRTLSGKARPASSRQAVGTDSFGFGAHFASFVFLALLPRDAGRVVKQRSSRGLVLGRPYGAKLPPEYRWIACGGALPVGWRSAEYGSGSRPTPIQLGQTSTNFGQIRPGVCRDFGNNLSRSRQLWPNLARSRANLAGFGPNMTLRRTTPPDFGPGCAVFGQIHQISSEYVRCRPDVRCRTNLVLRPNVARVPPGSA